MYIRNISKYSKFVYVIDFSIICNCRSHILQADTVEMLNAWIAALHRSIDAAIQNNRSDNQKPSAFNNTFRDTLPGAGHTKKM